MERQLKQIAGIASNKNMSTRETGTSKTLLLVDDEPTNLAVLRQILQADYHLLFALDGKKALELGREKQPDLILLDVVMPELSGYEVCKQFKQDPATKKIPVIFISGMADISDETHGFDVGAVDYIAKPVNPAIVKARVAAHLSLARGEELQATQPGIIHSLGRAAEYRGSATIKQLGRYEIIEELGRGAMGVVYKARDPLIDRNVAVKTINLNELKPDEKAEYAARFYQEARAAGQLNHPNIVTIHDLGESDGMAYIAMELLEGKELYQLFKDGQLLPVESALEIAIQVAAGMAYAHEHGIVHRDIKPSNIMVLGSNRVKIADFGIAHMAASMLRTQNNMLVGSPLYMSPEQVLNGPIDSRSDIFSLGIVLYQMLTGKLPFYSDNIHSVMYQIVNEAAPKLGLLRHGIPDMLEQIVARCLAKKTDGRFNNASELAENLRLCHGKLLHSQAGLDRMNKWTVKQDSAQRLNVLLVEDDPVSGDLLQMALEQRGHTVSLVTDGETGWKNFQERDFSLVILDWLLPGMDGLAVCRNIRSGTKGGNCLVLMITANTSPGDIEQVLAAGADDYLSKPVDFDLLNIRLSIAELRVARLRQEREAEAALRIAAVAFESQESLMITDAHNVILRVNQAFTDMTGYTAEEVVGRTPSLFRSRYHDANFYRKMWEIILRTGKWQGEISNRHKNGEIYPQWLSISAVKGLDGAVTHYVASYIERRQKGSMRDGGYHGHETAPAERKGN